MSHPISIKDVERLVRQITSLSWFISHSTNRCVEVFKVLKGCKSFDWSLECTKAFKDIEGYLTSPLILSKLEDKEELEGCFCPCNRFGHY